MFKKGDRVRRILSDNGGKGMKIGDIGTITEIRKEEGFYEGVSYRIDGYDYDNNGKYLEHCRIKNTKIARKMNPNHKVIDENWIEV